ncbi:response regulator [uncultured Christiangramia sp.]|uniref:response regulator n=1 Tax=uncultured Christiangramia sp. TaxID=503836 RepID=UPI0025D6741C|nr:response regulator [uncultured Christiangramia sp.]|tara:strand:- start:1748 stop:2134 length:387 start_codon:yes stop_codon:yes gene_type:complete
MARILIVDDDQTIGLMLKDILEFSDHKVTVSQQPKLTKENILQHDIELILLDKLISGVDGTDVCAELKSDEEVAHVPIIMMSALHNVGDLCKSVGAVEFIPKPFDMETLLNRVSEVLAKDKSGESTRS